MHRFSQEDLRVSRVGHDNREELRRNHFSGTPKRVKVQVEREDLEGANYLLIINYYNLLKEERENLIRFCSPNYDTYVKELDEYKKFISNKKFKNLDIPNYVNYITSAQQTQSLKKEEQDNKKKQIEENQQLLANINSSREQDKSTTKL